MKGRGWAPIVAAGLLAAGCGDGSSPAITDPDRGGILVPIEVFLLPDVTTFKVDGQLRATFDSAPPFLGGNEVGTIVLPAGLRRGTGTLRLPERPGFLILREITFTPAAPFLCGQSGSIDPRTAIGVEIALDLCQP